MKKNLLKRNLVKEVCEKLEITQKELAEQLDIPQPTMARWAKGELPRMARVALELMIENKDLKYKLSIFKEAHRIANEL